MSDAAASRSPEEHNSDPPRTDRQIAELRRHNRSQDERIERMDRTLTEVRVALLGFDGQNGLRGELRQHQVWTREALDQVNDKLDKIVPTVLKTIAGVIAGLVGLASLVGFAITYWPIQ